MSDGCINNVYTASGTLQQPVIIIDSDAGAFSPDEVSFVPYYEEEMGVIVYTSTMSLENVGNGQFYQWAIDYLRSSINPEVLDQFRLLNVDLTRPSLHVSL